MAPRVAKHSGSLAAAAAPAAARTAQPDGLPEPVARFFDRVLPDNPPRVALVHLEQEAEFFVGGAWRPLEATQVFSVQPPGFVWDARITILPLVRVWVRDSYVHRRGGMQADLLAVYPMVRQSGREELDSGALHRYLAEAVWFPTALLPSASLRWTSIDSHRALATLTDGRSTVSAEFRFTGDGDVSEIFTPVRFAEDRGRYEPRPWLVRCSDYAVHQGMRIPARCEVAWQPASGSQPYWRGRVKAIRYGLQEHSGPR